MTWQKALGLEARLRATLDTVHDAVIVIDERGIIVEANRAVRTLLGHEPAALTGRNVSVLMGEPDSSAHDGYLRRYLAGGPGAIIGRGREVLGLHADGHLVPIELAVNRFEVEGHTYFCGTLRDLSAQHAAERAQAAAQQRLEEQHEVLRRVLAERTHRLDTSDQFLGSALDSLSPHVAILDDSLTVVVVNRAWRAFGESNAIALGAAEPGTSYLAVLERAIADGDDVARGVKDGLLALLAGQSAQLTLEYPCHEPDRQRWFLLRATRFVCARGTFVVTAHEDITERHLAHDELRRREALLRAVIETAPDSIFIVDESERIELIGHLPPGVARSALVGRALGEIAPAEYMARIRPHLARALETGEVVQYEAHGVLGDAPASRVMSLRVRRLQLPDSPTKLLFFATDVTERKKAELELLESQERLRQAQKMEAIGQLAGGIAHDFNNLLTAIRYHASFALDVVAADDPVAAEVKEIDRAAERATALTRQLLAFGRQQPLEQETLDPAALAEEVLPMLRRLVGSSIRIDTSFAHDARWILADRGQLQQVLTNLVVNARDAIGGVGTIVIATRREKRGGRDGITLSVADDGAGMTAEVRARIFEPFYSTKGAGRGTGLGLAMVYGIVTQSSGTISVSSELGKGSQFEVWLPRVDVGARAKSRAHRSTPSSGLSRGERILLVEDDEALREGAVRTLTGAGYVVTAAASPAEAVRCVEDPAAHVDLLLSDVIMPDLTGPELARRARASRPRLAVLLVSGFTSTAVTAVDLSEFDFLEKPFTPRQLLTKIRQVLESRSRPPS